MTAMEQTEQTPEDAFHFYAEVRITHSPRRPELAGRLGAILGITEPRDPEVPPPTRSWWTTTTTRCSSNATN